MTREVSGELEGSTGMPMDDLPMGSVVYVGRKSFRMEAVALEPELARELGIVQPIEPVITAPLHAPPRAPSDEGHAPPLRSLFSSHVSIPLLAAPSGAINAGTSRVTISRASLVTLGSLVLLCGIVVGTAARHLLARPAPLAIVAAPATAAPPAIVSPAAPAVSAPAPVEQPREPALALPAPVKIHVRAKVAPIAAAQKELPSAPPSVASAPKPWVDPWAE